MYRRHDVCDHVAQQARAAGVAATDIYLSIDQQSKEMWLDARITITMAAPDVLLDRALGEAEARKWQDYRQPRAHPN